MGKNDYQRDTDQTLEHLLGKGHQQAHTSWYILILLNWAVDKGDIWCLEDQLLTYPLTWTPTRPTQVSAPATCGSSMPMETSRSTTHQRWGPSDLVLLLAGDFQNLTPNSLHLLIATVVGSTVEKPSENREKLAGAPTVPWRWMFVGE